MPFAIGTVEVVQAGSGEAAAPAPRLLQRAAAEDRVDAVLARFGSIGEKHLPLSDPEIELPVNRFLATLGFGWCCLGASAGGEQARGEKCGCGKRGHDNTMEVGRTQHRSSPQRFGRE